MNDLPFDRFTLAHVLVGYLFKTQGVSLGATILISIGWEVIEPTLKEAMPDVFPHAERDSNANKIVDVLAVVVGWTL